MPVTVTISDDNYRRLQGLAVPLVDTLDDVLARVIDVAEPEIRKESKMSDNRKSTKEILDDLESKHGLKHNPISRKRVLFELSAPKRQDLWFLWTPGSRIYDDGRAWVDLNEKQKQEAEKGAYRERIGILRLGDGDLVYLNLKDFGKYLTIDRLNANSKEGSFWRIYIWHRESVPYAEIYVRNGENQKYMSIQVNNDTLINKLLL